MARDYVVFDLGGVLNEYRGVERLRELSGIDNADELNRRWLTDRWVRRFERGQCSPNEFAEGLVHDWSLKLTPAEFLLDFTSWIVGPFPGADELVALVASEVGVACLSNTNIVHWNERVGNWAFMRRFNYTFLSFELGLVKPDPIIFDHVATTLGVATNRILFLDDSAINVVAAQGVGLDAARVQGVDDAREALIRLDVLQRNGN